MRIISRVAAIAVLLMAVIPTMAAGAQDCATAAYCVDSSDQDAGAADSGGGGQADPAGSSAGPTQTGRPLSAPSGALPITGGDAVGMAVIGAVAIALGSVLVHRSKQDRAVPGRVG